jgi:hypothetical protein
MVSCGIFCNFNVHSAIKSVGPRPLLCPFISSSPSQLPDNYSIVTTSFTHKVLFHISAFTNH